MHNKTKSNITEPHTVNLADIRDESYRSYPGRSQGYVVGNDNPCSDVWLSLEKSAGAIVLIRDRR
ncbi:hypothetical protein JOD02_001716 [Caldicoprobacter guelmensis]|uniref:hypothetical protein n=1 Tax=Caldicoprobacter guelmensis TaxID=1170224 RepID=UPI001956AFB7|nr:hypothetical protein [Caldicoprobacter guelmensis]MBM7582847.1 hypothetical protein [Caldicoprobacter guelmensis]